MTTPLGLTAGEILTQVDSSGAITLQRLMQTVHRPPHLIVLALDVLVQEGLTRKTDRESDVLIEPIVAWPGAAGLRSEGAAAEIRGANRTKNTSGTTPPQE